jgi:hypothetical protein
MRMFLSINGLALSYCGWLSFPGDSIIFVLELSPYQKTPTVKENINIDVAIVRPNHWGTPGTINTTKGITNINTKNRLVVFIIRLSLSSTCWFCSLSGICGPLQTRIPSQLLTPFVLFASCLSWGCVQKPSFCVVGGRIQESSCHSTVQ